MSALLLALLLAGDHSGRIIQTGFNGDLNGREFTDYLNDVEAVTAGSGAPNVLTTAECGKTITNVGSTATAYNTLPAASAGCTFRFNLDDATDGIRITGTGDDVIRISGSVLVSGAAGYIQSTDVAGRAKADCEALSATEWHCETEGDWTVDGTTEHYLGGGLHMARDTLTEALLVGTSSGDYGHTH